MTTLPAASLREMNFLLKEVFDTERHWQQLPELAGTVDLELTETMLEQFTRLAIDKAAPLRRSGDEIGALRDEQGRVSLPPGYTEAWRQFAAEGWMALGGLAEYGGQPCSHMQRVLIDELGSSADMALSLYMGLSSGVAETLAGYASTEIRAEYLPLLYSGQWSGAMCLTEPQAGSDLRLLNCRAEPRAGGSFSLNGNKQFISGGMHDMTDGVAALVLARLPDAPPGNRGISMFLVPNRDAAVKCLALEKKMGLHASATCSLSFENAEGWLIGEPNCGLVAMFTMMNSERLAVAIQALGSASAALMQAEAYAGTRLQGVSGEEGTAETVTIDHHADVQRMLMTMQAFVQGMRGMALYVAMQRDLVDFGDPQHQAVASRRLALLIPVIKAFCTDIGFECCVTAQQILGGYGYIREMGIEQYVRDVRVTQIYEGTNGIQARDLLRRKLLADGGAALREFCAEMEASVEQLSTSKAFADNALNRCFGERLKELQTIAALLLEMPPAEADACAVEFLQMTGYTVLGWIWLRAVAAAPGDENKGLLADYYFNHLMPRMTALAMSIKAGGATVKCWGDLRLKSGSPL